MEDRNEVAEFFHLVLAIAEFARIVKIGKVTASEAGVRINEWLDDLRVDFVADVVLALESDHVLEARALGDFDWGFKSIVVAVFIGDVFDEKHEQDVILVLRSIHPAAQFIAGGPKGRVEIRFLNGHEVSFSGEFVVENVLAAAW